MLDLRQMSEPTATRGPAEPPQVSNENNAIVSATTRREVEANLLEMSIRANKRIDDVLLKVPGGAVGLSIAYIWQQTTSTGTEPPWSTVLVASWLLWVTSFLLGFWSQVTAAESAQEAWMRYSMGLPTKGGKAEWWTTWLNRLARGTFTLAALLTVIYFILNLGGF